MLVKILTFIVPTAVGLYFGFTTYSLGHFLLLNNLTSFICGVLIGFLLVTIPIWTSVQKPIFGKDLIMLFGMPIVSSLVYSNLFGLILYSSSYFFR